MNFVSVCKCHGRLCMLIGNVLWFLFDPLTCPKRKWQPCKRRWLNGLSGGSQPPLSPGRDVGPAHHPPATILLSIISRPACRNPMFVSMETASEEYIVFSFAIPYFTVYVKKNFHSAKNVKWLFARDRIVPSSEQHSSTTLSVCVQVQRMFCDLKCLPAGQSEAFH